MQPSQKKAKLPHQSTPQKVSKTDAVLTKIPYIGYAKPNEETAIQSGSLWTGIIKGGNWIVHIDLEIDNLIGYEGHTIGTQKIGSRTIKNSK